jgi:hypothetical protein
VGWDEKTARREKMIEDKNADAKIDGQCRMVVWRFPDSAALYGPYRKEAEAGPAS